MSKTYSRSRDAARAARDKLGKNAMIDVHFTVVKHPDGKFEWSVIDGAPDVAIAAAVAHEEKKLMEVETAAKPKPKRKAKIKTVKAPTAIRRYLKGHKGAEDVIGKRRKLVRMILSPEGASLESICKALGWQKHTVRGAVSTLKSEQVIKKLKSFKTHRRGRCYRAEAA